MKRLLLILLIFSSIICAQEKSAAIYLTSPNFSDVDKVGLPNPTDNPDEILKEKYNEMFVRWGNWIKYVYQYDKRKRVIFQTNYLWIKYSNVWKEIGKTHYKYDSNDNLLEKCFDIWKDKSWHNSYRYIHQYKNNNRVYTLYQRGSKRWQDAFKFYMVYNKANLLIEKTSYRNRSGAKGWIPSMRHFYKYKYDKNIEIFGQIWDPRKNKWADYSKRIVRYDSGYKKILNEEIFVPVVPEPVLAEKWTYEYQPGKAVFTIQKTFNGTLTNYKRADSILNSDGKMTYDLQRFWKGYWCNSCQWDIKYLSKKLKQMTRQEWNGHNWENDERRTWIYKTK